MNKVNYDKLMFEEIAKFGNEKKELLLHSCCAPCSTACIEKLMDFFNLTIYYYNPNIDSEQEFLLRANEQKRYCEKMGISCIVEEHDKKSFLKASTGLEQEKEGGKRCENCFYLRLKRTAQKAKELNFDYFATTLTVSPLKNSFLINEIGLKIQDEIKVSYLVSDFKKRQGYLRSIELSKENELYRQNYCGCEFSK